MMKKTLMILLIIGWIFQLTLIAEAGYFPYTKKPIARDQILEIADLYYRVHWRADADNIYSDISGARCPYTTDGWKDAVPYCWAGADEIYEYLRKMTEGRGAGDRDTSSTSPYNSGLVGSVDCSGYASQCFRSGRYTTSSFYVVSADIGWDNLAPGDAINDAGSHIRVCEKYPTSDGKILVYESTSGGGIYWKVLHRVLSYDNGYAGIRYDWSVAMPSLLDVLQTGPGQVTLTWQGAASTGFRIYQSLDGSTWSRVVDETTLDEDTDTAVINGLTGNQLYYFRVVALNGTTESGPSTVFSIRLAAADKPSVLIVHGFDSWLRQSPTSQFNDFLKYYATALDGLGIDFETCDNFRVTREEVDLSDYSVVIWMAGEESTHDYALNFLEELRIQAYLEQGGCLFISGSEIGYDLVENDPLLDNLEVDDTGFFENYLKADYIQDDANTYSVTGIAGSIFEGLSFDFDNGTQGTYDVNYPDILNVQGGSVACLTYGGGNHAAIQYSGIFGSGASGKIVYLGIPFETIYPESARNTVMERVIQFFELIYSTPTPTDTPDPRFTATNTPTITQTPPPTLTPTITPIPTIIIVDNEDGEPKFTSSGSWSISDGYPPYYGDNCIYTYSSSSGITASAVFRPNLPYSGEYEVRAYWRNGGNRSPDAPYTIHGKDGVQTIRVNQQSWVDIDEFYSLGNYSFDAGNSGYVELTNDASSSVIMADAVMFLLVSQVESPTPSPTATGTTASPTPQPKSGLWMLYGDE